MVMTSIKASNPVPAKNLKRITSYVSPENYETLERWATKDGRSVSNLVSRIVDKAVSSYQKKQKSAADEDELEDSED